ncbi:X-box-binding protein 1-like [Amphiura filiformis]|uniref:X-box-binding protein 1-like n=1 Tax=Amphiura filiformis TaxID=82378 RepID=UPI003B22492E
MAPTKIYITSLARTQPGKRPLTAIAMPVTTTSVDTKPAYLDAPAPPRKRQRLTHLSPEEKLMRRKLKNRVAAQTARDRKKTYMDGLEDRLAALEEKTKRVQQENREIKHQNALLVEENIELKRRLGMDETEIQATQMTKVGTVTSVKKESKSHESAALDAPPQQGQVWALSTYLTLLMTMSLMCCLDSSMVSKSKLPSSLKMELPQMALPESNSDRRSMPPWWGPQQKNWNPSKN